MWPALEERVMLCGLTFPRQSIQQQKKNNKNKEMNKNH